MAETTMGANLLKSQWKSENSDHRSAFNRTRLVLARKRKGFSKLAFAKKVGVTRKSVEAWEAGTNKPVEDAIAQIIRVTGFPRDFFMGDDLDEPSVDSGSFRSMKTMTAAQRDMALSQAALGLHFNAWLTKKFGLPPAEIPNLGREPDPEAAAEFVRREWGLGTLSVRNMVHLLESKGARVYSLAVDARQVDAFSMWKGDVPFVFLNTNKTGEHSRFDAAHELGHLVLHRHGPPQGIEAEKQANAFASAFLMPRGSVFPVAPKFPTYDNLVRLKRTWGVSVAALAYRLHSLKLVSDWQFRGLYVEISKRGKDREPRPVQREASVILKAVLSSLYDDGISRPRIAEELTIPTEELEQLLFGLTMTGINGGGRRTTNKSAELTRVK
jgi:Zn-dependent peptidase ImmA (M78 family)/transcriptional regulator with XRE-family HTH domain